MGSISQDLPLSSLLSLSLSLNPTVTMLFLPRLTLLLFIAFLGFSCLTQVKANDKGPVQVKAQTCKEKEHLCKLKEFKGLVLTGRCLDGKGNWCKMGCRRGRRNRKPKIVGCLGPMFPQ